MKTQKITRAEYIAHSQEGLPPELAKQVREGQTSKTRGFNNTRSSAQNAITGVFGKSQVLGV